MKVLVSGANGFIGRHVVQELLRQGHEVVASGRRINCATPTGSSARLSYIPWEIGTGNPQELLEKVRPQVLFHAAWDGLDDYRTKSHVTKQLPAHLDFIRAFVEGGTSQCLVTGTCLEYGLQEGELSEDLPAHPVVPYAEAKLALYLALRQLQETTPFVLQWTRLFYLYGPGQRQNTLLSQLDQAIARGDASFPMSPGDQQRDYLSVDAAARVLVGILSQGEFDGIINCCSGNPTTVLELAQQYCRSRGSVIHLETGALGYPQHEPRNFWGSVKKLHTLLGVDFLRPGL